MAREDLHFRLRIPGELKEQVRLAAEINSRSMTAEIIDRLERSFSPETAEGLEVQIREFEAQIEELTGNFKKIKNAAELRKKTTDR